MRYLAIDSESIESFVVFLTLDFFMSFTSSPFSILTWNPLFLRYLYRGRWYMPVYSMPMLVVMDFRRTSVALGKKFTDYARNRPLSFIDYLFHRKFVQKFLNRMSMGRTISGNLRYK
jgi:hypothetical protein